MDEKIRKIGLGTVQFGMPYGISNREGQTPPAEVRKILSLAERKGIEILDTASVYGNAEKVLGEYDLSVFNVVSKFMPPEKGSSLKIQLEQTLQDLQLTSIYGYLAHRPVHLAEHLSIWEELQSLKEKNVVKKIGFSLNEPDELEQLLKKNIQPDLIQVPFNYLDRRFKDLMISLKEDGCEIHSRSAFLQGLFFLDIDQMDAYFSKMFPVIKNLQKNVENLAGALLNFVISQTFIDKVIIGVQNSHQLRDNIASLTSSEVLPELHQKFSESLIIPSNWPT